MPVELWIAYDKHLEHEWAERINKNKSTNIPLTGFGSSDCKCPTHLFFNTEILSSPTNIQKIRID